MAEERPKLPLPDFLVPATRYSNLVPLFSTNWLRL